MAISNTSINKYRISSSNNGVVNLIDSDEKSKTVRQTAVDESSQFDPWNPDDLYQKTGDYSIYEDMMKDDQVSVAMAIKKDLIIGSGWNISIEESDDEDVEIKRCIDLALKEDVECSFDDILQDILTAYEIGFSVSEKQFKKRKDGKITLKNIRTRNPVSWLFHQDKFGNIIRYEQQGTTGEFTDIDPNALLHFVNNPRYGAPYGTSDLRSAYKAWFIKKEFTKYLAIFLEKYASPLPVGKYDRNISEDKDIQDLHDTLKKLQNSSALTVPDDLDLEFIQTSGDGKAYISGINLMNMFIGRALFVPDLLGFQGGETTGGAQALGREQMVVFFKHIMRRRRTLQNVINHHIVKPIVRLNYGERERFPKFELNPISEEQAESNARLWLEAVKGFAFKPTKQEINHFKSIVDFPESKLDEEEESDPIDDAASRSGRDPSDEKGTSGGSPQNPENKGGDKPANFKREDYKKPFDLPPGDYHQKTDFKIIEKQLDSQQDLLLAQARPVIREVFDKFADRLRNMNLNNVNNLKKLEDLKLPKMEVAKFRKVLQGDLMNSFVESKKRAAAELNKENFAVQPEQKFLETLEQENLNFINDWEFEVTKRARVEIIAAVKDGRPISSVIDILEEDEISRAVVSTERYSRTKLTEVMNKGRVAFFKESGVVSAYQYSAVLDDRTTEICRGLHGKIFREGTEPVPPLHFNCRSVLVPITQFEEFNVDKKVGRTDINDFIEENKGKGFSKQ